MIFRLFLPLPLDSMRWYCSVFRFSLPRCATPRSHLRNERSEKKPFSKTVQAVVEEKKSCYSAAEVLGAVRWDFLFRHWTLFYDECRVTEGGWKLLECIARHPLIAKWSGLKNPSNPKTCWCPWGFYMVSLDDVMGNVAGRQQLIRHQAAWFFMKDEVFGDWGHVFCQDFSFG